MRPYVLQPLRFIPFLGTEKRVWPKQISTLYYLSFEDALWDLLPRLGYKKGSVIFVPRFYCEDVVSNMKFHGYKVIVYPQNDDYSYNVSKISDLIVKHSPDVFIEFQIAGIKSTLLSNIERKLPLRTLLVSDRVHEFVYPHVEYFPHSDRHIIISSYRKVSAFNGSIAVFTRNVRRQQHRLPWLYTLRVLFLWTAYIALVKVSYIFSSVYAEKLAERILQVHNDLVGDELYSAPLPSFFTWIYSYIAIEKIFTAKEQQYERYMQDLAPFFKENSWVSAFEGMSQENYKKLRGFPLLISTAKINTFLDFASKEGLFLFTQLDDLLLQNQQYNLVLLPMGPHLPAKVMKSIRERTIKALTLTNECDTITA